MDGSLLELVSAHSLRGEMLRCLSLGTITGISKEGWQYLWVRFIDDEDTTAKALIKRPVSAYVEQVYSYGDFSGLGIGV